MSQTVRMKRISAKKKEDIVLRLLRGEDINDISRELKIPVPEIETWKNRFLIAAREGLKTRGKDPVIKELEIAKKTIGELTMELNLHKKKRELDQKSKREFVDEYRCACDPNTGKRYPVRMILRVIDYSSSSYYGHNANEMRTKPGPKGLISDDELVEKIKETIKQIPFHGTGYKKIHARLNQKLREKGISVGKNRVFWLMQSENLLNRAPGGSGSSRIHDGSLVTDAPDVMWGTDGKKFFNRRDGWCWLFAVIDHFNSEVIGYTVVKNGDRFEATRAVQNAIQHRFGTLDKDIAKGVSVRSDRGSQYTSAYYMQTMSHYGIEMSHTWARSPESNGIIERFFRTIEEQLFKLHDFATLEEAEKAIGEFIELYNTEWMLERLGYISPKDALKNYYKLSKKSA